MVSLIGSVLPVLLFVAAASAAVLHKPFECIKVRDLDPKAMALKKFPFIGLKACAHKCVAMDTACNAYHYSNKRCYLLPPASSWKEQQQRSDVEICIKANGETPKCTARRFPHSFGRSRYAFVHQKLNWRDAATHCEKMDAKLAQLTTFGEMVAIRNLLKKERADAYTFNGLIQLPGHTGKKDGWVWHRSGDKLLPGFWHRGEPNNWKGKQHVGAFYKNGQLDDNNSWALLHAVCECRII